MGVLIYCWYLRFGVRKSLFWDLRIWNLQEDLESEEKENMVKMIKVICGFNYSRIR